jgi:poly-beta-1,6-N-acetyl-D-glucosamine synthase
MFTLKYVIITPAHNEEANIEKTIQSMLSQTILPEKWVIVSDGSTDGTDDIVKRYASKYDWIEFVKRPYHNDRQFAAKVHAFNAGYEKLKNIPYQIIGNLDADITFDENYFEFLLGKFNENNDIGVAGTPFIEESFKGYDFRFANIEHVSGACQLFRRECFESIGGYKPVRGGGIDWIAVTTARMKGWKTRTFTEKTCTHHRKIGTGNRNPLLVKFDYGMKAYYLGGHPLWELIRAFYQMKQKPYFIGGILLFSGYVWGYLSSIKRPVSDELVMFYRREQMNRLKNIFYKMVGIKI